MLMDKNTDMLGEKTLKENTEQKYLKSGKAQSDQTVGLFPKLSESTPLYSAQFAGNKKSTNQTELKTEFPDIGGKNVKQDTCQLDGIFGLFQKKNGINKKMLSRGQEKEEHGQRVCYPPILLPLDRKLSLAGKLGNNGKAILLESSDDNDNTVLPRGQKNRSKTEINAVKKTPPCQSSKKGNKSQHTMDRTKNRKLKLLEKKLESCIQKSSGMDLTSDSYKTCLPYKYDTDTKNFKIIELNKSNEKINSDQLLLKLTKQLPMRLLLKTDQTLQDLGTALGFEDRRSNLLVIEHSISNQSPLDDERFKNLMVSLEKYD